MTGDNINLIAELRKTGKGTCRGLRRGKRVPAVVYGPKVKNIEFSVEEKEIVKYIKSKYENAIFNLQSDDSNLKGLKVLRKETDIHPVTRRPTHIDFYALDLTTEVRVSVEVIFDGKAAGIREGGVLNVSKREVEVECLPSNIPRSLVLDITDLELNESLQVSALTAPEGVKILTPDDEALCTIATVEEEVVAAPAEGEAAEGAEAAAGDAAAPAAEGEKKEEEKKD